MTVSVTTSVQWIVALQIGKLSISKILAAHALGVLGVLGCAPSTG
jgi:hypothetical protein